MNVRVLAAGLVVAAACADAAGRHELGLYALLAAVPATAAAALEALSLHLETRGATTLLRVGLWVSAVVLVVVGSAARYSTLPAGGVPAVGVSALVACLAALSVEAFVAAVAEARRREPKPVLEEA